MTYFHIVADPRQDPDHPGRWFIATPPFTIDADGVAHCAFCDWTRALDPTEWVDKTRADWRLHWDAEHAQEALRLSETVAAMRELQTTLAALRAQVDRMEREQAEREALRAEIVAGLGELRSVAAAVGSALGS